MPPFLSSYLPIVLCILHDLPTHPYLPPDPSLPTSLTETSSTPPSRPPHPPLLLPPHPSLPTYLPTFHPLKLPTLTSHS
eukprot:3619166-Rhodomonas_salina.1